MKRFKVGSVLRRVAPLGPKGYNTPPQRLNDPEEPRGCQETREKSCQGPGQPAAKPAAKPAKAPAKAPAKKVAKPAAKSAAKPAVSKSAAPKGKPAPAKAVAKPAAKAVSKPSAKTTAPKTASKSPAPAKAASNPVAAKPVATAKAVAAPPKTAPVTSAAPIKAAPAKPASATSAKSSTPAAAPAKAGPRPIEHKPTGNRAGYVKPERPREEPKRPNQVIERVTLPAGYKPNPKEEYMNSFQLEYFRQKLLGWRKELVEESQQTIENLKEEVRDVGDEAERATRETENALELRTRDRYRKLINKIDSTIRRLDEGDYGFCVDTGEPIGLDRLEARPTAERTLDAQERWEHLQKQMGD